MGTFDFSAARLAHLNWNMKLRSFLDGRKNTAKADLISHMDCSLGKWIYSKGLPKYGTLKNMKKLEKVHIELHETTKRIIEFKEAGDTTMAEKEYEKLKQLSEQIISLLNFAEKELK